MADTTQDIIDALDDVLDQERSALLEGDLDMITRLLGQKEELFDRLKELQPEEINELDSLQGKVMRNQVLLDGALQGIRAVADRMGALRRIRKSLETYDKSGKKLTIESNPTHKVEKRA